MNSTPGNDAAQTSSSFCTSKGERTFHDNQYEQIISKHLVPEKNSTNTFIDISKTPKDVENEILNEAHSLFADDVTKHRSRLLCCTQNCHEKITIGDQKRMFETFWQMKTFNSRAKFVSSLTESKLKAGCFLRMTTFYLNTDNGRQKVCKSCFLSILGISVCLLNLIINENYKSMTLLENDIDADLDLMLERNQENDETSLELDNLEDIEEKEKIDIPVDNHEMLKIKDKKLSKNSSIVESELSPTKLNLTDKFEEVYLGDDDSEVIEIIKKEPSEKIRQKIPVEKVEKIVCFITKFNEDDDLFHDSESSQSSEEDSTLPSSDPLLTNEEAEDNKDKNIEITDFPYDSMKRQQIGRSLKQIPPCTKNCHLKIKENDQRRICKTYWQKENFKSRFKFVNDMTETLLKPDGTRKQTKFYLNTDEGRQLVCRRCFCLILEISSPFIRAVLNQKLIELTRIRNQSKGINRERSISPETQINERLRIEEPEDVSLLETNVDSNFVLDEEDETSLSLEKKLDEIDEEDNKNLPVEMCYIKEEVDLGNDVTFQDNQEELSLKIPKEFHDIKTEDIKIQYSTDSILPEDCDNTSEILQDSEEKVYNEAPLSISNDDHLVRRTADHERPEFNSTRNWSKLIPCSKNCHIKIKEIDQELIFNSYWQKATLDSRSSFVNDMTEMKIRTVIVRHQLFYEYESKFYLKTNEGRQQVCRGCFQHILAEADPLITSVLQEKMREKFKSSNSNEKPLQVDKNVVKDTEVSKGKLSRVELTKKNNLSLLSPENKELVSTDEKNRQKEVPKQRKKYVKKKIANSNEKPLQVDKNVDKDIVGKISKVELTKKNNLSILPPENKEQISTDEKNQEKEVPRQKRKYVRKKITNSNESSLQVDKDTMVPIWEKLRGKLTKKNNSSLLLPESKELVSTDEKNQQKKVQTRKRKYVKKKIANSKSKLNKEELSSADENPKGSKLEDQMDFLIKKYRIKREVMNVWSAKSEMKNTEINNVQSNNTIDANELFSCESQVVSPTEEEVKKVEEHIKKFPLCESYHYNRQSSEKYLPMGLTIKIMYDLYKNEVLNPISIVWYQKILELKDIKFKLSFLAKCNKCSAAALQYKLAKDPSEKSKINLQRTAHLIDSEEASNSKSQDEQINSKSAKHMVCSFGFQQSLPTPYLDEPTAYYKQRLWTYNFTVQSEGKKSVGKHRKFYMWHEAEGERSANEIASCLYQYLNTLPPEIKIVIFYSTSCNGESRSKTLSTMFLHLMANHKTLETLEHKFLISEHSQIDTNLGNSLAEEIMKCHQGRIHEPKNWYDAFEELSTTIDKSEVTVMNPEMFYDFESMKEDIFGENELYIEKEIKWLQYTKSGIRYKKSWSSSDRFQVLNLKDFDFKDHSMRKLRNLKGVAITEEKKKDLLTLLPLMKSEVKSFYESLPLEKDLIQKVASPNHEILSSPLKRKFEESEKDKNKDISENICIIKQENVDKKLNDEEEKEPSAKTFKKNSNDINSSAFELVVVKEEIIDKCH